MLSHRRNFSSFSLEVRRKFFSIRAAKEWNELPEEMKMCMSINRFKDSYDRWRNKNNHARVADMTTVGGGSNENAQWMRKTKPFSLMLEQRPCHVGQSWLRGSTISNQIKLNPPPPSSSSPPSTPSSLQSSLEAQNLAWGPKSQPWGPNHSLEAQIIALRLKFQPQGSNPSLEAQFSAFRLKSQPQGLILSF